MPAPGHTRILEIGPLGYARAAWSPDTLFFDTADRPAQRAADPQEPRSLSQLVRLLRAGEHDLVVCMPPTRSPWHWQSLTRQIFNRRVADNLKRPLRLFAPQMLRFFRDRPLAVMDFADTPYIDADNLFLLDRATLYFKRELPGDEWRLLTKTAAGTQPSMRMRGERRWRERLAKVRPLPLGLPLGFAADLPGAPVEKRSDVFFAGTVKGFPVRERALAELEALRREGVVVDIPDRPMPRADFYRRCAEAWLTLSPEGHGWDCFRHYEAAACGSVPLMNHPTTRRHAPLVSGEHALYFDIGPGGLKRAVRDALADRARLAAMGEAGRAHVLGHHTPEAILRHVVDSVLAEARRGG